MPMKMSAPKRKKSGNLRNDNALTSHTHAWQAKTFSHLLSNDMCWFVLLTPRVYFILRMSTTRHSTSNSRNNKKRDLHPPWKSTHRSMWTIPSCDLKASVCVMFGFYRTTKTNKTTKSVRKNMLTQDHRAGTRDFCRFSFAVDGRLLS